MNLLGAKLYDPAVAVSKSTASLLAMTAFDTVNLRVAVTIPAHGMIYVRVMGGAIVGATTVPTVLLGVMNGATVLARITPQDFPGTMNATTQSCPLYAEFVITGLAPGAMNLDLAYGVEVVVALTNIKYGGPNNVTTNDAWGGISFQVWDPQPLQTNGQLAIDANGRVDVSKVLGTAQTARDLGAQLDAAITTRASAAALATVQADTDDMQTRLPTALVGGRMDANVGALGGTVQSATDLKDFADTGYDPALHLASATAIVSAPVSLVAAYDAAKTAAQAGNAMALTVSERASVADKLLGRTRAGGADGGRTVSECLAFGRNRWAVVAGILTVYADDGLTPLYTAVVTTASSNPVISVTPS